MNMVILFLRFLVEMVEFVLGIGRTSFFTHGPGWFLVGLALLILLIYLKNKD